MVKKGKYQLLSYLVDQHLIFYKSLNRNRKIIAFAIFEASTFNRIIPILNGFLKKRFIQYYSIQLNTLQEKTILFLLNFEEIRKENIVQLFNIIRQNFAEENLPCKFHIDSTLEQKFLDLILTKADSSTSLRKLAESILVTNNETQFQLDFFSINIDRLDRKNSFLHNFISIINNFNRRGFLIITFLCNNDEEIKFSLFFSELIIEKDESFITENNINNFFNCNIMKKQNLKLKEFHNYLWRIGISDNYFLLKDYSQLFPANNLNDSYDILTFNVEFEQCLIKNNVKFIRFSDYLLFIERAYLFLTLPKLRSKFIQRIIKKYLSEYFIYILILNEEDSKKLIEIKNFTNIKNVQILNLEEISKFDFNIFKRQLKNS